MKILGIDYGAKHVGLAKGDDKNKIALPFLSLDNKGIENLVGELRELVRDENVEIVVVGYPINLKGGKTGQTREVESFAGKLRDDLDCEVVLEDERLSSVGAKKMGSDVDEHQLAAQSILQGYLDRL